MARVRFVFRPRVAAGRRPHRDGGSLGFTSTGRPNLYITFLGESRKLTGTTAGDAGGRHHAAIQIFYVSVTQRMKNK